MSNNATSAPIMTIQSFDFTAVEIETALPLAVDPVKSLFARMCAGIAKRLEKFVHQRATVTVKIVLNDSRRRVCANQSPSPSFDISGLVQEWSALRYAQGLGEWTGTASSLFKELVTCAPVNQKWCVKDLNPKKLGRLLAMGSRIPNSQVSILKEDRSHGHTFRVRLPGFAALKPSIPSECSDKYE